MRTRLLVPCLLAAATGARSQGDLDAIWRDATFQKQFVGSYGIHAEVEPRASKSDLKVLEKVQPLMGQDLVAAQSALEDAIDPDCSAMLDFTLGNVLYQQNKLPEALACYQRAVGKFPSFRRAFRNLGLIHVRNGSHREAIAAFTRMIELGGGDAYAYGLLGFAHASLQDHQPAEAAYRTALLLQPDNAEWRLGLVRCVFRQGKYEDTITLLDSLLARFPDKADFWVLQAQAFLGLKQPLKAAESLESVDIIGKATADNLHNLADIYAGEGLAELAASAYLRAIDRDPAQPAAKGVRAVEILVARGAPAEARTVLLRVQKAFAATLQDADRRRLAKLDARLAMADGTSSPAAVAALEEVTRADPLDGEALLLLGQHHVRQNEPERAVLCFERAANIEAFEARARISHAQVLVKQSRFAEALPLLRRAQELKPRDDVARYVEQVERLARSRK